MKTDHYTKIILTIIAFCLVVNMLEKFDVMPKAYASEPALKPIAPTPEPAKYGLVPVNKDGSVNVTLKNTSPMDVNIVGIRTYDDLDVNVNLEKIGGSSTYGAIPVRVEK